MRTRHGGGGLFLFLFLLVRYAWMEGVIDMGRVDVREDRIDVMPLGGRNNAHVHTTILKHK